jgi:hypothetical protein
MQILWRLYTIHVLRIPEIDLFLGVMKVVFLSGELMLKKVITIIIFK